MTGYLSDGDYEAIVAGDEQRPFYPIDAPGMPTPGEAFTRLAKFLSGEDGTKEEVQLAIQHQLSLLYARALYAPQHLQLPLRYKGRLSHAQVVASNYWGGTDEPGPHLNVELASPRVMVVGKQPGRDELTYQRAFVGPSGSKLLQTLESLGYSLDDAGQWYLTNLVRWLHLNPSGGTLPAKWIADCLPLLQQELRILQPDYVLCLGAEATKAVCGKGTTVQSMVGRSIELTYPVNFPNEDERTHTTQVLAAPHPAAVLRNTAQEPQFRTAIEGFVSALSGRTVVPSSELIDIQYIYKARDLRQLVDHIIRTTPGIKKIAVDAEWHGDHAGEPGSYLRSIQISWADNVAAVIVLASTGGYEAFYPSQDSAIAELGRLLLRDDIQLIGHFFNADLPWLAHAGLDLTDRFTVPDDLELVRSGEYVGGFDTSLAAHSYEETADFKLEILGVRYCGADRWDTQLSQWLKAFCQEHGLLVKDVEGYGECPDEILFPYGGKDAAYTRKLRDVYAGVGGQRGLLHADRYGNDCWQSFQISMQAFPGFAEMHQVGIKIDLDRLDELTDVFMEARELKLHELRTAINWPTFNPRSNQQSVEMLFGPDYGTKRESETGRRVSVMPEGAITLGMQPIKTTDKPPKPWSRVVSEDLEDSSTPSTDKEVCGILALHDPRARMLRDVRLLDQTLKSVFRPPAQNPDGELVLDASGRRVYEGGIATFVCNDDRVRSFFTQHKETGRGGSSRPALHNLSKRREADYRRILGDRYRHKIRSCLVSNTDPDYGEVTVLVEADFKGAELFGIATQARDPTMIEHCLRANLDEDDPNFYDIHSNVAVQAFQLHCEPTKSGLASIEREDLRVAAKNVIFGGNYGRHAEAMARQAQEEGVDVTVEQIQRVVDAIYAMYPEVPKLQQLLRERAADPGWIMNCFGRLRRCIPAADAAAQGELERQFLNFPFQSMVADALSIAIRNLLRHPLRQQLRYRICLSIHDAVMLEVPVGSVEQVCEEVLPSCMVDNVSFFACRPDGSRYPNSDEYRFGIDIDVMERWGEKMTWSRCDELGVPRTYGKPDPEPVSDATIAV